MLKEGVERPLSGDVDTGKAVLRDDMDAMIGFRGLGDLTEKFRKCLMRVFDPDDNPQARNLFEVIGGLQEREGLLLKVQAVRQAGDCRPVSVATTSIGLGAECRG